MKVLLRDRDLLRVSGTDSEAFLQNQLRNDITKINHSIAQINAYCQHQGKIIGLLWVIRYESSFLISFPEDPSFEKIIPHPP